jgi:hypothetical protein
MTISIFFNRLNKNLSLSPLVLIKEFGGFPVQQYKDGPSKGLDTLQHIRYILLISVTRMLCRVVIWIAKDKTVKKIDTAHLHRIRSNSFATSK